ncbi:MAG: glycosyltransferase family 9 protein, partial [Candidatus Sumerlaeota bacterium]
YREGLHYPELYCRVARVDVEDYRYDFDPGPWPRWRAARWLAKRGLDGEGFIALHTHSRGMDSKTWPADEVTKVTRALSDQRFVVIGYQPDREVTRTLEDEPNVEVSFAPIRVQAGVMEKARLFVGIDSGPRQIAAALGTQALCLFGPRPPEHLPEFPGDRNLMVDCPHFPCYGDPCPQGEQCMRRLDSDLIVENINEMLQECSDA